MESVLTIGFNILSFSSIIVLVVLGLGVIASMMRIFNFAHGEFMLLGGYTTYLFYIWNMPIWLGILAAPFVVAFVGLILERANSTQHNRQESLNQKSYAHVCVQRKQRHHHSPGQTCKSRPKRECRRIDLRS